MHLWKSVHVHLATTGLSVWHMIALTCTVMPQIRYHTGSVCAISRVYEIPRVHGFVLPVFPLIVALAVLLNLKVFCVYSSEVYCLLTQ